MTMRLRPRVEVLCFREDDVLCRHVDGWTAFPGGGIDHGESVLDAARRESREEADRHLRSVTVAHAPTLQIWPEDYTKRVEGKWGRGFDGGLTHWVTATTVDEPENPRDARHKDYEEFQWTPIPTVLGWLKAEVDGEWGDDVIVRLHLLKAHRRLQQKCAWRDALPGAW